MSMTETARTLFVCAATALGIAAAGALSAQDAIAIRHTPVRCVAAQRYPRLTACFDPDSGLAHARLVFRAKGRQEWRAVEMVRTTDCYGAVLPRPQADTVAVQYYIEAVDLTYTSTTSKMYEAVVLSAGQACATQSLASASPLVTDADGAPAAAEGFEGARAGGGGGKGLAIGAAVVGAGAAAVGVAVAAKGGSDTTVPAGRETSTTTTAPASTTTTLAPTTTTTRPPASTTTTTTQPPSTPRPTTTTTLPGTTTTSTSTTTTMPATTTTTVATTTTTTTTTTTLPATTTTTTQPATTTTTTQPATTTTTTTQPATTTTTAATMPTTTTTAPGARQAAERGRESASAAAAAVTVRWTSTLTVQAGSGQIVLNGSALSYAGAGAAGASGTGRAGENRIEAQLVQGSGPGLWRFDLGPDVEAGSVRSLAGNVVDVQPAGIAYRLAGHRGERVVFVFRVRPGSPAGKERVR